MTLSLYHNTVKFNVALVSFQKVTSSISLYSYNLFRAFIFVKMLYA